MGTYLSQNDKPRKEDKMSLFKPSVQSDVKITKADKGMSKTMTRTRNATEEIRRLYDVKDILLGAGAFGKVYLAHSKDGSGKKFAVKVLSLKKIDPSGMAMIREELDTLCELDHPYIATYVESFEDKKYLYIVMEYCDGQEMFKFIEKKGHFTEDEAA